jgi:hypothetical protein
MVNEYLVKQTLKMFHEIASKLIHPGYKLPQGGEPTRVIRTALQRLEKQYGALTGQRIVDYVICSAHAFKDRGSNWKLNQVFGPKSMERFNTDKGRVYYENKWLSGVDLSRNDLLAMIVDRSEHPKAKYVLVPSEEGTKMRLLNREVGFVICQTSTLGWSPLSEACSQCNFIEKCKVETQKKFPEIYRLRTEYVSK